MSDDEGSMYLWYSKKMRRILYEQGEGRLFGQLENGEIVEYTIMTTEPKHGTKWDDIILLGKGDWHHSGF